MGYSESFNELEQWRDELRRSLSGDGTISAIEARIAQEADPDRLLILDRFLAQEHAALGHHAAAAAIRARRPDQEILRWHDDWRESHLESDVVAALEERIRGEAHPLRLHTLRWLLADEHRARGNFLAAEAVSLADADANPDSARPLIALASQKLHDENLPEEAMRVIDRAVAAALRSGLFRREALGVKARIALELADYRAVEDVLRQIMGLTVTRGHMDIGAERDFFDRLPPGSVDPEVARAYDDYCRARGRRRTASTQEIDGFILAAVRPQWLKVARIIADVLKDCERNDVASRDDTIAVRIQALVAGGRLEAQGDPQEMALQRGAAGRGGVARGRGGAAVAARARRRRPRRLADRRRPDSDHAGRPPATLGCRSRSTRRSTKAIIGAAISSSAGPTSRGTGTATASIPRRRCCDRAEVRGHRALREQGAQGRQAERPRPARRLRVSAAVEHARRGAGGGQVFVRAQGVVRIHPRGRACAFGKH